MSSLKNLVTSPRPLGGGSFCRYGWLLLLLVTGLVRAAGEPLPLNLKDADIESVIATVSAMTGKNFIIDPRVKGKVTIVSSQPMDGDTVYQVFLSLLDVHGFAAVPAEGAIKIVPASTAKQGAVPTATARSPMRGDEYITRVIGVDNVQAAQLVPILRPLLPQDGHLAAYQDGNVLIASGLAANIERLVQIIRRIDREGDEEIEVFRLTHASATEVVRILAALERGDGKGAAGSSTNLVADERTNSLLINGSKSQRLRLRALATHLDTPLESSGNTEVVFLHYANAKELVPVLSGISKGIDGNGGGKGTAAAGRPGIFIDADESSNALVITAAPDMMRSLRAVIHKLDIRRAQVMVEAVIAEVGEDSVNELGIQWAAADKGANLSTGGLLNFSSSSTGLLELGTAVQSGSAVPVDGLLLGIGGGDPLSIGALLKALAADARNNILATPNLLTMDNQEAEIVVGTEVPYLTGSYTSTGSGSTPTNPFQTFERKDVGLTLRIKPQVNEGSAVKLEVTQEVSSVNSVTSSVADLVTNKRSIQTVVMVDDGETIVLGGLIDEQLRESVQKVPLLGDIPLLGALFRYNKSQKVKTNLMVFLRPTIIRDASHNSTMVSEKYNYMRAEQLKVRDSGVALMSPGAVPVLPLMPGGPAAAATTTAPAITPPTPAPAPSAAKRPEPQSYWSSDDGLF